MDDPFGHLMEAGAEALDSCAALVEEFDRATLPRYRAVIDRWADLSPGERYEFLFDLREDNLLRQLLEGKVI